jgi:hypothetical protein
MSLPGGGPLSINNIRGELATTNGSLRTLSAKANFSTPDKISDFYNYNGNVDVYYKLDETSYHTFSDANLRINAWDNNNTQVLTDYWIYTNTGGYVNLGSSLGLAIRSGWRFEVYVTSFGNSTTSSIRVQRLAGTTTTIVEDCNWLETGAYSFTVYSGGYYEILAEGGSCLANIYTSQNTGQLYDGCSESIDTYGWTEGTAANGVGFGPYTSGNTLTYNSEKPYNPGVNDGTFLTFGGNTATSARSGNNVIVTSVIASAAYPPCTTMYTFIDVNGVRRTTAFYSQGSNVQISFTFNPSAFDYTCNIGLEQY